MIESSTPGKQSENSSEPVSRTHKMAALSSIASINRRSKLNKRFVSRREYVAKTRHKMALASIGIVMFCMGFVSIPIICRLFENMFQHGYNVSMIEVFLACIIPLALPLLGAAAMKWGRTMDVGIPLTYNNTADLPAEDSLVRASQKPVQEQTSLLLRMAIPPQATPPEEMVRVAPGLQKREGT